MAAAAGSSPDLRVDAAERAVRTLEAVLDRRTEVVAVDRQRRARLGPFLDLEADYDLDRLPAVRVAVEELQRPGAATIGQAGVEPLRLEVVQELVEEPVGPRHRPFERLRGEQERGRRGSTDRGAEVR